MVDQSSTAQDKNSLYLVEKILFPSLIIVVVVEMISCKGTTPSEMTPRSCDRSIESIFQIKFGSYFFLGADLIPAQGLKRWSF